MNTTDRPSDRAAARARILVVDDEPDLRTLYELTLLREGYEVDVAETVSQGRVQLQEVRYDAVITDMRLPDGTGVELLQLLRQLQRPERCVVITAYGSAENAVEALKAGAFDYLTKPVDLKQFRGVIASAIEDAAATRVLPATESVTRPAPPPPPTAAAQEALQRMVGRSPAIAQIRERIVKVARSMAPVLITGESGTGKELTAQALHANSHRAQGPLVAVNCSAIPETLLEAEFFGVKKGAYTGATHNRDGYFQAANGGTLFLDEIGDLPLSMQSKLLRAIQERYVRPVGASLEEPVDVRIVSATHRNLAREVQEGRFRQDLFYRLNVIALHLPPLRERREDLPELCCALLERICRESAVPVPQLPSSTLEQLARHPLAGNVRELENLLHRALALSEGDTLSLDGVDTMPAALNPLEPDIVPTTPSALEGTASSAAVLSASASVLDPSTRPALPSDLQSHLDQQEREFLVQALKETGYNRTAAAAKLGITLRQIRYRIARLNIETPGDEGNA